AAGQRHESRDARAARPAAAPRDDDPGGRARGGAAAIGHQAHREGVPCAPPRRGAKAAPRPPAQARGPLRHALRRVTNEARLQSSYAGLVAATDGWFVVNVRDAAWVTNPVLGDACVFEGD